MFHVLRREPFRSIFEDEEKDLRQMTRLADLTAPFGILKLEPCGFGVGRKTRNGVGNGPLSDSPCACSDKLSTVPTPTTPRTDPEPCTSQDANSILSPTISNKTSRFEVNLNLDKCYNPGELKVTLSADQRSVVVEGRCEESKETECGYSKVSSEMYQRIALPEDVDVEGLKCDLNENGVMVLSAPRKLPALESSGKENIKFIPVKVIMDTHGNDKIAAVETEAPATI